MDRGRKGDTNLDIAVYLFIVVRLFLVLNIQLIILRFPRISHCWEIRRCKARLVEGFCVVREDFVYPIRIKGGFCEVSLARRFMNPDGIAWRVPAVWVLFFPMYFNCCPFFLTTLNCRSPSMEQPIFMPRNGNLSFVTTWTLSSFVGRGVFTSIVHIYALKWRCWLPATMFTICWKSSYQSLIYFTFFFPLSTTRISSQ